MAVKKRLGEMLVEAGIIGETQLHAALGHQRQWGGRLGGILVELKLASEEAIVDALALKFGFDVARLDRLEPYAFGQAKALVPREYAVRNHVFPISADTGVLTVAMSDPTNLALTDELAFRSGRRVKVCIAGENAITAAVRAHYGADAVMGREAIALDVDDGTAVEPLYDPIGATSSEELNRFFQQPAAAIPPAAPPVARGSPAGGPADRKPAARGRAHPRRRRGGASADPARARGCAPGRGELGPGRRAAPDGGGRGGSSARAHVRGVPDPRRAGQDGGRGRGRAHGGAPGAAARRARPADVAEAADHRAGAAGRDPARLAARSGLAALRQEDAWTSGFRRSSPGSARSGAGSSR